MVADLRPSELTMLKVATHDLIKACGGIECAAEIAGVSKALVASWYGEASDDGKASQRTIPSLAVLLLERNLAERGSSRRPVSDCLARLMGADAEVRTSARLAPKLAEFAATAGEAMSTTIEALADGKITRSEAKAIDARLRQTGGVMADMRASIAAVLAGDEDELNAGGNA